MRARRRSGPMPGADAGSQLPMAKAPRLVSGATNPKADIRDVWPTDKGPLDRSRERAHMRVHTTLNLLPNRGFPIGTAKIQFSMCIPTVSTGEPASCLAHEQVYYKRRYLAIEGGICLWAKAAEAWRLLPGVNALSFRIVTRMGLAEIKVAFRSSVLSAAQIGILTTELNSVIIFQDLGKPNIGILVKEKQHRRSRNGITGNQRHPPHR